MKCDCISKRIIPGETGPKNSMHRYDCPNMRAYWFYYDEGVDAWVPCSDDLTSVIGDVGDWPVNEELEIRFKSILMTPEEFRALPED